MSEAMIVVAKSRGYYGEKPRYEGERFAITDKAHFSSRWMIDPNSTDYTSDIKAMEQNFANTRGKPAARSISDEQLLAEVTQSAGVVAGLRAENLKLKEEVSHLKEQISALQGKLDQALVAGGGVRAEPTRPSRRAAETPAAAAAEPGDNEEGEGDGDVGAGEETPTRRVRRTL